MYLLVKRLYVRNNHRVTVEVSTENTINAVRVLLRHAMGNRAREGMHMYVQTVDTTFSNTPALFPGDFQSIVEGYVNPHQTLGIWMTSVGMDIPRHRACINVELEEPSGSSGRVSVGSLDDYRHDSSDAETRFE